MNQDPFSEISKNLNHEIPQFAMDGELKRFKDSKGKFPFWAIGRQWEYKGNMYSIIKYGDWRDSSTYTWKNYNIKDQSKQFVKKQRENLEEIVLKEKYETKKKNDKCIELWKPKFKLAKKTETIHEYLQSKSIKSNHIAKIDHNDTLMIPAYDQNGFTGVQLIYHSVENDRFVKRFSTGIKLKGSFCPIGKIKDAKYVYVAEGFATAATIYEATNIPTICAWNCNNMHSAIKTLRTINPKCRIIIAADKDTKKESKNIGIKKALFCKSRFSNIIIKIPEFEHFDSNNTDFNDLLINTNLKTIQFQLSFSDADFIEITLLGHDAKKYYYFNSQSLELKELSVNEHNELHLLSMAGQKYWGERYRFKLDNDGNETTFADFKYCVEKLFEEQRLIGFFNYQNIRGYGTWIDKGRTIVNLGDRQIVDNNFVETVPDSKYLYTSNYPMLIDWDNPLSDDECKKIIDLFKLLNYKNTGDYIYLTAFIAISQVFNAIDWRFQLWLTGSKGSGKTEIMKMMSKLIFDSEIYQSVTAASIRQYLGSDAIPMIIDEAEPNCQETKRRMDGVIELIRQCSSRMNTKMLRGTASGQVLEYNINSIFCLASIQTYLPTQADVSRFFTIEMNSNENSDIAVWLKIQAMFNEVENFAPRLFARMVKMIPVLKDNVKTIKELLVQSDLINDPRQADQIATAMASHFALISTNPITDDDFHVVLEMVKELNIGYSEYESDNEVDEAEKCFDAIFDTATQGRKITIGKTIELIKIDPVVKFYHNDLEFYGMKFFPEKDLLFISANNRQLKKELNDTMYHDFGKILKRHKDFIKYSNCRIGGRVSKGIYINVT